MEVTQVAACVPRLISTLLLFFLLLLLVMQSVVAAQVYCNVSLLQLALSPDVKLVQSHVYMMCVALLLCQLIIRALQRYFGLDSCLASTWQLFTVYLANVFNQGFCFHRPTFITTAM